MANTQSSSCRTEKNPVLRIGSKKKEGKKEGKKEEEKKEKKLYVHLLNEIKNMSQYHFVLIFIRCYRDH